MIGKNSNYVTILTDNGNEILVQINKNNSICDISLTGEESMCNFVNNYAE